MKFQRRNGCVWRKGFPVQHSTGKEILYTLFGINLSRSAPVSCPAQTNLPSGRAWYKSPCSSHSGYFYSDSESLSSSLHLSLSGCHLSFLFLVQSFPASLPSVSPLSKGYLAESYARGMFTVSLIDWWGLNETKPRVDGAYCSKHP